MTTGMCRRARLSKVTTRFWFIPAAWPSIPSTAKFSAPIAFAMDYSVSWLRVFFRSVPDPNQPWETERLGRRDRNLRAHPIFLRERTYDEFPARDCKRGASIFYAQV